MPEAAIGFLPRHGEAGLQTLLSCGGLHKPKACCTKNLMETLGERAGSERSRKVRKIPRSFQPCQLDLNNAHRLGMPARRLTLTSCPSHDLISTTT